MPDQARKAQGLLTLLTEVRQAKPDARDFALFERRDALNALGVPHAQIDGFDATDDAALDEHIADARIAAAPPLTNPLLPATPWPKNGPTWQPYNPTKDLLPAPPSAAPKAPPAPQIDPRVRALLDTITAGEIDEAKAKASGFSSAYDTPYGYGQFGMPPKPLSQMTVGEVKAFQRQTVNNQQGRSLRSSAMGRYQFMPGTLPDIQRWTGIKDSDLFSPDTQERMAMSLLKRRRLDDYLSGGIDADHFQDELAQEWSSIGMSKTEKSYHNQPVGTPAEKARQAILNLKHP